MRYLTQAGRRLVLWLVQLIIIVTCTTILVYSYRTTIAPDKQAKETFKSTTCLLMSKKLASKGYVVPRYRADFLVSYQVYGEHYTRWVTGNGLDMTYHRHAPTQEEILSQFKVGGRYPCYYDPYNPETALLIMRHDWLSIFPLFASAGILLLVIYFFVGNVRKFFKRMRRKH